MSDSLLAPGAVLALWTIVMLTWVGVTRFRAFSKIGIDIKAAPPGGRGVDLEGVLPPETNWKSHNYTHLCEQPTVFYAVAISLAVLADTTSITLGLGWAYVVLRVIHSLVQTLINKIEVRFALFALSSLVLIALTIRAALLVF